MAGFMTGRLDNIQLCLIYWRCGFTAVCIPGATRVTTRVDIQLETYLLPRIFAKFPQTSRIPMKKAGSTVEI
jgi:hypothetical protein